MNIIIISSQANEGDLTVYDGPDHDISFKDIENRKQYTLMPIL